MQGPPQGADGVDEDDAAIFTEINVTPLTDVFIVLLIIFMVVSTTAVEAEKEQAKAQPEDVVSEQALQVRTPDGTGDSPLVPKDVVISILPDGTLFVEDEQINVADISAKLALVKKGATSTRVVIRGDQAASYDLVMKVITAARANGLTDVALASRTR